MFEFEPDEYIFTKFARYFKRRKKNREANLAQAITLESIKGRLTIIARALTGQAIEIYEAEREGGFKNNNFFLPTSYAEFGTAKENISFYLFRILYLTIQKEKKLNWRKNTAYSLQEAQNRAKETAPQILKVLFTKFPATEELHQKLVSLYSKKSKPKSATDFSFIYGKWMRSLQEEKDENLLKNISENERKLPQKMPQTALRANAVEEIISKQVDKKQVEDAVLQHQFEKVETAEEFGGNFRTMDGEDELNDHANALEELNMKYTVRVDNPTHSVYQADFVENITIKESAELESQDYFLYYDEWDYSKRTYKRDFCKVFPVEIPKINVEFYRNTISKNNSTLIAIRKMLTILNNKYQKQRRQSQGDEYDLDALTDLFVDLHSNHTPSENIYLSNRKKEKDLSILLLLDISLSTDGFAAGNRIIDVEKQVSILFGEILNEFTIDFSINGFYSKTRNRTTYVNLKGFDEQWEKAKYKIGGIEPVGYTRIGPALRHSGALLDQRATKNKWIILISDGKPNDYDRYEGKYGFKDIKQALQELKQRKINSYALAIEAQAKYYLSQMFGQNQYQILTTPIELLESLAKLYSKIKHHS